MYNAEGTTLAVPLTHFIHIHRMSVAIVSIPLLEIGDFVFRIKQKTLSTYPAISLAEHRKDTFSF